MKDFLQWQRGNNGWQTQVVWRDGVSCGVGGESVEKETDDLELKNPLKFGTRDLRTMEGDRKNLSPEQKRNFRDMAGYFLSIKQKSGTKNLPPHMLVQIEKSSLFTLLSKKMQEQIKNVLDSQIDELIDFAEISLTSSSTVITSEKGEVEDVTTKAGMSSATVIRASLLYRRLRSRAHDDPRLKSTFDTVQKNLLGWSISRLKTGSVSAQVNDTLAGALNNETAKPLTQQEKLIIAAIYRMFPDSKDWVDYCDGSTARKFAKEAVEELKENPSDPRMVMGWGFIDEWQANGDEDMVSVLTSTFSEEELQRFMGRARAVELLQFAKNQTPFLPVHLRALNALKTEPEYLPQVYSDIYWQKLAPEMQEIKKIDAEQDVLKQKFDTEKDAAVEQHKKNSPDAPEVVKYLEAKQKRGEAIDTCWNDYISQTGELVQEWDNIVKFEAQAAEAREKVIDGKLDLDEEQSEERKKKYQEGQDAYIANYKNKLNETLPLFQAIHDTFTQEGEVSAEDKEATIKDFQKLLKEKFPYTSEYGVSAQPEEEAPVLKNIQTGLKEYEEEVVNQEKAADDAIFEMPFNKNFEDKKKEYEKQRTALEEKQKKFKKDLETQDEWNEIFSEPQKYSEQALEKFWSGLGGRVNNRQLNAADFEVLWNDEFAEELQEKIPNRPEQEKIQKFRTAFESALTGIFDGLSSPDDKYETFYAELDERLSYDNLIQRVQKAGFDIQNEFQKPQQLSEVLEGAVRHYRENIFEQIKGQIAEEKQDEFYSHWDRLHGHLSASAHDPTIVAAEHSKYELDKLSTVQKIQEEQEKNLAIIEALRKRGEENPAKAEHYNAEAKKLEDAWEVRKKWYESGGQMTIETSSGKTKTIWAPGKRLLSEMAFQSKGVETEIHKVLNEGLKSKISEISEGYKEVSALDLKADKIVKTAVLKTKLESLFTQWPQIKNTLKRLLKDHQTILKELLPEDSKLADEFVKNISDDSTEWLNEIDKQIIAFQQNAKSCGYKYYGDEMIFANLPKAVQGFTKIIDFNSGQFAENSELLDSYLKQDTETVEFLDNSNFFSDESENKEDFREKYKEMSGEFQSNLLHYQSNFNSVRTKLKQDMKKLDADEFAVRHGGMSPGYMNELIEKHENQLVEFNKGSSKFLSPSFFDNWLGKYNKSPESRANALGEMSQFRGLTDWSGEAKKQSESMNLWINDWEKNKSKMVRTYQSFSLHDLYALVKQTIEVHTRRWDRESERAVANIGLSFFGRKSGWGKEFYRKSQETEAARVKEIETELDEDPWWDIQETLYTTNDPDEAKAIINLLIGKGVFRWDDPKLWKTFMRLSNNAVVFTQSDMNLDISQIIEKCRNAVEAIWTRETFRQWDTTLESKVKAKEDEFASEFQRYEHIEGAHISILQGMLKNWSKGKRENSDPAKYALFIRKAFEIGKLNGGPLFDVRWYFLTQGIKHGLLSRDFFGRLNLELLPQMPYFDFFTDKNGWKKDGKFVPKGTPGAHEGGFTYEDYIAWADFLDSGTSGEFSKADAQKNTKEFFYEFIYQSDTARGRTERMVRNGTKSFDHDDGATFTAGLTAEAVTKMLNTTSTDEDKYTPDFWRNVMAGYVPYFQGISQYIKKGDAEYGKDNPEWIKMRERNLTEVADRMKAMTILFHSILGNINLNERKPIIFQASDFDKKEGYSPCARGSFEFSNKLLNKVFDASGTRGEFESISDESTWLQAKGETPPAKEEKNSQALSKVKNEGAPATVTTKVYDLTKGPASKVVFTNKNVEKMLLDDGINWNELITSFKKSVYRD